MKIDNVTLYTILKLSYDSYLSPPQTNNDYITLCDSYLSPLYKNPTYRKQYESYPSETYKDLSWLFNLHCLGEISKDTLSQYEKDEWNAYFDVYGSVYVEEDREEALLRFFFGKFLIYTFLSTHSPDPASEHMTEDKKNKLNNHILFLASLFLDESGNAPNPLIPLKNKQIVHLDKYKNTLEWCHRNQYQDWLLLKKTYEDRLLLQPNPDPQQEMEIDKPPPTKSKQRVFYI
jgi:hypothetical protein